MPQIGDYLVTATGGWFGKAIRRVTRSPVNHAAVYVGDGMIVEAQPGGAKKSPVTEYPNAIWSHMHLSHFQRVGIAIRAENMIGTPYSFLDIFVQALVRIFGWHAPGWAIKRLSSPKRLQCAQLVDYCYQKNDIELFPDGRPNGLVSPGDLLDAIQRPTAKRHLPWRSRLRG